MNLLPVLALLVAGHLPFTVDASEDVSSQFPGAPRIQSFSFAQWKGRWVFIGGRVAGYHSVGGGMAEFLRADANREVWVIDTTVKPARTYHAPLEKLPAALTPVKDQWASTAQLHYQDGAKLYICGGYGQDHEGAWVTFPLISQVDLPSLIEGVMHGRVPAESIRYAQTPLAQSAGGALTKLPDGNFYLVMGHVFTGSYTAFQGQGEHNTQAASQTYLNEIRKLRIIAGEHGVLALTLLDKYRDTDEFHRRDLNMTQILSPKGMGLAVYGGVFTPETQLSYSKPVYLFGNSQPMVDSGFDQKMNAYSCAKLLMYDRSAETMYTTFFGGISRFTWDPATEKYVENPRTGGKAEATYLDGLQWSDQISTIRKVMAPRNEETTEMVHSNPLPGFLGTDSVFIPAPELARAQTGSPILDFQSLEGTRTFVGYIYGGIRASPYRFPYLKTAAPYNAGTVPTRPSDLVLKVFVEAPRR
jgi:hypothetical protein